MDVEQDKTTRAESDAFVRAGAERRDSLVSDYFQFLRRTRKWWLVPLLFVLFLFGVLFVLVSTGAAPFLYTLF